LEVGGQGRGLILRFRLKLKYAVNFGEIEFGSVIGNRSRLEFGSVIGMRLRRARQYSRYALETRETM
jgi:hypothetical protein